MAYIKNEWVDQQVERPKTYQMNENVDGSVTLIDDFGQVTEIGTPVNADNMNHIEDGIANSATVDLDNLSEAGIAKLGIGANKQLSNLEAQGQNIANWSTNITNCITEIPQDIKLELNNGTLTLKAGSKVYKPDGTYIMTPSDVTLDAHKYDNFSMPVIYLLDNGSIATATNMQTVDVRPTAKKDYTVYFVKSENKVYWDEPIEGWRECTLPLGLVSRNSSVGYYKVDQVFNGFGYIGSTVFALPNVKGLIPNYKNNDGSLKSIVYTNDKVKTRTFVGKSFSRYILSLSDTYDEAHLIGADRSTDLEYNQGLNTLDRNGVPLKALIIGQVTNNEGKGLLNFEAKQPFHAVDFYDYLSNIEKIGKPEFTLDNTLSNNEIWLEGATVSRASYPNLFAIYGTTYGAGDGSTTFQLPNFKNRTIWGTDHFGYIEAGLPNITGGFDNGSPYIKTEGAFYGKNNNSKEYATNNSGTRIYIDASRSNKIYGNSSTVRPPAVLVRVKTRYK